jgi:hypothetical protein
MYQHRVIRFRYTAYDVTRTEDVVNPNTPHCHIMMLANTNLEDPNLPITHRFLYARVLGIYHVDAAYVGPGSKSNSTTRYDFLWVRWFERTDFHSSRNTTFNKYNLETLTFPPMSAGDHDAFGFVDPNDVLRGCHIIPRFSQGLRYTDGHGLSKLARDKEDWREYYVGR